MKEMKKIFTLALLFISAAALAADTPKIEFQSNTIDFGRVKKRTVVKSVFEFKNTGTADLEITEVTAGCACTGTLLSDKSVPAGSKGQIEVSLNTGREKKRLSKSVYIYTNDPKNSIVVLYLTAYVDMDPKEFFGDDESGAQAKK